MNNFFVRIEQFVCAMYIKLLKEPKQTVYVGDDSTFNLVKELKKKQLNNVFVATDKTIVKLNLIGSLLSSLKANNINYIVIK